MKLWPWMRRRREQRGEGRIGAIIALLVVVALIYFLIKLVPMYLRKAELSEEIERATREYAITNTGEEVLYATIIKEAEMRGITLEEEDIELKDSKSETEVSVDYTEVIPMIWGDWSQDFTITKDVPKL